MSDLNDAILVAIANELNYEIRHNPTALIFYPNDVIGIEARWDEGETSDNEDYGLSPRPPSLEIEVTLKAAGTRPQQYRRVSVTTVLTALLKAVLDL